MTGERTPGSLAHPVVFYDGECGLCDRSVRWLLDHDRAGALRFAPLQGETYAKLDGPDKPTGLDTIVFADEAGLHERSTAVLRIGRRLGGAYGLLARVGFLVPRVVRDAAYRFVATRRLRWFGGAEACRLPSRRDAERLLP